MQEAEETKMLSFSNSESFSKLVFILKSVYTRKEISVWYFFI